MRRSSPISAEVPGSGSILVPTSQMTTAQSTQPSRAPIEAKRTPVIPASPMAPMPAATAPRTTTIMACPVAVWSASTSS